MFTITISPTSPGELREYLAVIRESGITCQSTVATVSSSHPAPGLVERYKAATGKAKAHLSGDELKAAGWNGEGQLSQYVKDKAMAIAIERAESVPLAISGETDQAPAVALGDVDWDDV